MSEQDKLVGLEEKFYVSRADGSPNHEHCFFFVLDITDDPLSRVALRSYAEAAARAGYLPLAQDLMQKLEEIESRETRLRNIRGRS